MVPCPSRLFLSLFTPRFGDPIRMGMFHLAEDLFHLSSAAPRLPGRRLRFRRRPSRAATPCDGVNSDQSTNRARAAGLPFWWTHQAVSPGPAFDSPNKSDTASRASEMPFLCALKREFLSTGPKKGGSHFLWTQRSYLDGSQMSCFFKDGWQ